MSGKSPVCSNSLMLAKAFIWTVAEALRPNGDCLRICCLDLLSSNYRLQQVAKQKHRAEQLAALRGCSGQRTHHNTNGNVVWAWMLWSAHALGTRRELWFEHGCSGQRMLLEHEGDYGLGMDALVSVCSWNTKGIMVWAWMLWSAHALGTRRELWFGHGCSGQRMLLEHEGNYGLGMDALVSVCS